MAKVRFELDEAFASAILRSEGVRDMVSRRVIEGVAIAKRLAPKGATGDLSAGITGAVGIEPSRDTSGKFTAGGQVIGRIASSDFKTIWKEFGTVRETKQPFLRPAAEAIGNFEEQPR
jgi:hypothetical protein